MKPSALFPLLLCVLAAAGCSSTQVLPSEEDFPPSKYMTAVGLGGDRAAAIENARVELSRQISVRVREDFSTMEKSLHLGGGSGARDEYVRAVTKVTTLVSENDLPATDVAAAWYDRKLKAERAFVVLDRRVAGGRLLNEAEAAERQARLLFDRAGKALAGGRLTVALANGIEALKQVQQAVRRQLAGMVVEPARAEQFRRVVAPDLVARIKDSLRSQLADIHLRRESGDHQRVYPGAGLRDPVVVSARKADGTPIVSLPLRFRIDGTEAAHAATTGEAGDAAWQPTAIERRGATGVIQVSVDLQRLAGGASTADILPEIVPPTTEFTFHMPTRENMLFAVCVEGPAAAVRGATQAVTSRGFTAVQHGAVAKVATEHGLAAAANAEKLLAVLTPQSLGAPTGAFLFILAGSVEPGAAATQSVPVSEYVPGGKMYLVRSTCKLQLIDATVGEVVGSVSIEATEGDTEDESTARRRSAEAAAGEACSALLDRLCDRLELAREGTLSE